MYDLCMTLRFVVVLTYENESQEKYSNFNLFSSKKKMKEETPRYEGVVLTIVHAFS